MLEFGWTRHMIRTILVLSFDLCVHFFMVFLCLSHKQKLQEHFPLFIGLLILFEITYKLTIYEYIPLNKVGGALFCLILEKTTKLGPRGPDSE